MFLLLLAGDIESNPGPVLTRSRNLSTEGEAEANTLMDSQTIDTPKMNNHAKGHRRAKAKSISPKQPIFTTNHEPIKPVMEVDVNHQADNPVSTIATPTKTALSQPCTKDLTPARRIGSKMPRKKPISNCRKRLIAKPEACRKCKTAFVGKSKIITCTVCKGTFHKIKCGGLTRHQMDKIEKNREEWACEECRQPQEEAEENQCSQNYAEDMEEAREEPFSQSNEEEREEVREDREDREEHREKEKNKNYENQVGTESRSVGGVEEKETVPDGCKKCKAVFTGKAKIVTCTVCRGGFHKIKCGGLTRHQMDKIEKNGGEWTCEECRQSQREAEEKQCAQDHA